MDCEWIFFGGIGSEGPKLKPLQRMTKRCYKSDQALAPVATACSFPAGACRDLVPIGGFRVPRMDGS
jgi:hypothetical protein